MGYCDARKGDCRHVSAVIKLAFFSSFSAGFTCLLPASSCASTRSSCLGEVWQPVTSRDLCVQGCRRAGQQEHGGGHGARCGCCTAGRPPRAVPEWGCGACCAAQPVPAHRPHRMVPIAASIDLPAWVSAWVRFPELVLQMWQICQIGCRDWQACIKQAGCRRGGFLYRRSTISREFLAEHCLTTDHLT